MKKYSIVIITLFFATTIFAQTNFTKGFNNGYKKGYCQDQGISCIEPIPPIAPNPKIGENSNNYNDGYNRGFQLGLSNRKNNIDSGNGYKTSKGKFVDDIIYKAPEKENKAKKQLANMIEKRGIQNLVDANYDDAINDAEVLLGMGYYLQSAYFIKSKSYYHKAEMTNAYNFSLKIIDPNYIKWKIELPELYLKYLKSLLTEKKYQNVIFDCENIWDKKSFVDTDYFLGIGYYYQKDFKKAKSHFKKARDNNQKNDFFIVSTSEFLESISNENYIDNPYLEIQND